MTRRKCFIAVSCALVGLALFLRTPLSAAGDPLADLKSGVAALEAGRDQDAISLLKPLATRLPKLADYTSWFIANAQFHSSDFDSVPATLDRVFSASPASPLTGKAALLSAQALENTNRARDAANLLRKYARALPQPQGDLEIAKAMKASGDGAGAAVYAQRVYYGYPLAPESNEAQALIAGLQSELAERYPPALSGAAIGRIAKLLDAREATKARRELVALEPQLTGAERDSARVKIGVADYIAGATAGARKYLEPLSVDSPEADAERIYYLFLCARRESNRTLMETVLAELTRKHPTSPFRRDTLIALANIYLTENRTADYEPLYRACFEAFPKDPKASICHWKIAWLHYLQRQNDAQDLFREHLRWYPDSTEAPGALYYLARLTEPDRITAAAYYREIAARYPNFYYGVLARTRLQEMADTPAAGPFAAPGIFREIVFTPRRARNFEATLNSQAHIERARLLSSAGLDEWWEFELRSAANSEDQPHVMALELAKMLTRKGSPDQALRSLKHYVPDYLWLPENSAPQDFWRLAFPMPYRADLEKYARENNMDVFLMAALIRQESEFDPKAVSSASARGLMQITPSTGRELSRRLHVYPYTLSSLFQPQMNMRLGTYYLRFIADKLDGRWEAALAAYNAGLSRAVLWSGWGEFREPSEFVETVPFTQTRDYVQIIMRNADVYRRVYAGSPIQLSYSSDDPAPKKSLVKPAAKPAATTKKAGQRKPAAR